MEFKPCFKNGKKLNCENLLIEIIFVIFSREMRHYNFNSRLEREILQ